MKARIIFFLFVGLVLASCNKDALVPEEQKNKEAKHLNVAYGTGERNLMDVFLPEGRDESTPLIVLIHGGSWITGSKADMTFIQEEMLSRGFASVNINYNYASTHRFDDMLADIGKALETVRSKATEWGVRNNNFSIVGVSAGAHLGLLYAYGVQQTDEIRTVVSVAGPTDLATLTDDPLLNVVMANLLIGVPSLEMHTHPRTKQASPLYQVDHAIPTLLVHGTADDVVPYIQSQQLQEALQQHTVANKLITLQGAGHDVSLNDTDLQKLYSEVHNWILQYGT